MKKLILFFILFFSFIVIFSRFSFAKNNSISNVELNLKLIQNNLSVTEIWSGNFNLGTELYRSFNNICKSDITNFCVIEDGVKFECVSDWNIENSSSSKKNKSAIIQTLDGVELSFGIGEKGYHKFKIMYTINNLSSNGDEFYFGVLENNIYDIDKLKIKIDGNFEQNVFCVLENSDVNARINNRIINYNLDNVQGNYMLYLNYNGLDGRNTKNKIIKIKSKDKRRLFSSLKCVIEVLIILFFIILVNISRVNKRGVRYGFKSF